MTETNGELLPLPLYCVDYELGSTTLGVPCEDCPLTRRPEGCPALRAGARIIEITARHEREKARLLERLFNLRTDTLVRTTFTPEGMQDHLQHDEEIQTELRRMEWGVIRLDGRFVNYINRYGTLVGDDFLEAGGAEITTITDGLVRTHERRSPEPGIDGQERQQGRRQGHALTHDIICRQGGDEFCLLIRNVSPRDLQAIAARIRSQLTVSRAVDRYNQGDLPFIASVGYSHATTLEPEVRANLAANNFYEAFRLINGRADAGQRTAKTNQYAEMWQYVLDDMPASEQAGWLAQPDDRTVAETFLRRLCPDFQEDPAGFLLRHHARPQEG